MTKLTPLEIERKIFTALSIFPVLMPSQLQIALGTSLSPKYWRPILRDMVDRKVVVQKEVQVNENVYPEDNKRTSFHSVLCLVKNSGQVDRVLEVDHD